MTPERSGLLNHPTQPKVRPVTGDGPDFSEGPGVMPLMRKRWTFSPRPTRRMTARRVFVQCPAKNLPMRSSGC